MEPQKDFKTLINEALELKNITWTRLSQLTGIPDRYLTAFQNLNIGQLPAAPYVRGYLQKIALVLHLNAEELWQLYKKELTPKTSGALDKLPANRFAIQSLNKNIVIVAVIIVLGLLYILINANNIFGAPVLKIISPEASIISVTEPIVNLTGKFNIKDKLTINGEETLGNEGGEFQADFPLQPGLNTIEFKVKRFLGKETVVLRQVLYEPIITAKQ
ncbi:MAG: helix-turn-helix domain-containing protein [bacterium]|nr:helix-turn-helix domain-containing protein [bacterium]